MNVSSEKRKIEIIIRNPSLHLAFVILFSAFVLFYNLGENSLNHGDEASHAQFAKEILETGQWLTIHHYGDKAFVKAPVKIWLMALGFKLIGFSEFSIRFWSSFFALLTIILVYYFAKNIFDHNAAIFASLILATCTQFIYIHSARAGDFDSELTFFITLAMFSLYKAQKRRSYLYLFFFSCAVVGMIKHITMTAVPIAIFLMFIVLSRNLRTFKLKELFLGGLIVLAVILPWHIYQVIENGETFLHFYLYEQVLSKRINIESPVPAITNYLNYIDIVFDGFFPWSFFAIPAILYAIYNSIKERNKGIILLLSWICVVYIMFSSISLRRQFPWYIVPLYPSISMLCAYLLSSAMKLKKRFLFSITASTGFIFLSIFKQDNSKIFLLEKYNPIKSKIKITPFHYFQLLFRNTDDFQTALFITALIAITSIIIGYLAKKVLVKKLFQYIFITLIFTIAFMNVLKPLAESEHKSFYNLLGSDLWSYADPGTTLLYYGINSFRWVNRIYLSDWNNPDRITAEFIKNYNSLISKAAEGRKFLLMRDWLYFYIRDNDDFKALKLNILFDREGFILLSNYRPSLKNRTIKSEVRLNAPDTLLRFSDPSTYNAEVSMLKDKNPEKRATACRILGNLHMSEAAMKLIEMLNDSSPDVRGNASLALARLDAKEATGYLINLVNHDQSSKVRADAILSLGYLNQQEAVPYLKEKLLSKDSTESDNAAIALAYFRDKSSIPYLIKIIKNQSDLENNATIFLLGKIDTDTALNLWLDVDTLDKTKKMFPSKYSVQFYSVFDHKTAIDFLENALYKRGKKKKVMALHLLARPIHGNVEFDKEDVEKAKQVLVRFLKRARDKQIIAIANTIFDTYRYLGCNCW